MNDRVTYIGNTDYRAKNVKFGIKEGDRTRHMYIIGKTGMGKSTLLENMLIQDIQNGEGVCFIDPHGSSAEMLLQHIPEHRIKDVVYFAPHDMEFPIALNVLEQVDENQRHLVANGLMAAFKKIFGEDKFSDRIQYILNNIMLALLENEGQTLLGVNRMLSDANYRKFIVSNVKDPSVKAFWNEEFVRAGEKYAQEAAPGIQNKIGQFISNPLIRNIIGQKKTSFDLRDIMDNKKILICNFSIGRMGEGNVNLLGNLMITKIYIAAMSRANLGAEAMKKAAPFYFYVDEFQNFVNESFAQILSQARKYNLGLIVAHQFIEQMTEEVEAAVFGNVGTMILFRVGAEDAERFEKEFAPQFTMDDIVNLSARQIYLRLSIDGVGSKPFSATTLPPMPPIGHDYTQIIVNNSREINAKTKVDVEAEVLEFYKPLQKAEGKVIPISQTQNNSGTIGQNSGATRQNGGYASQNTGGSSQNTGSSSGQHHNGAYSQAKNHTGVSSTSNASRNLSDRNHNRENNQEDRRSEQRDNHGEERRNSNRDDGRNRGDFRNRDEHRDINKDERRIENKSDIKSNNTEIKTEEKKSNSLRDALNVALGLNINMDQKKLVKAEAEDNEIEYGENKKDYKNNSQQEFKQKAEPEIKQSSHKEIDLDKSNREIDHAKLEHVLSGIDFDKSYKTQEQ